jgi:hypothetical protein
LRILPVCLIAAFCLACSEDEPSTRVILPSPEGDASPADGGGPDAAERDHGSSDGGAVVDAFAALDAAPELDAAADAGPVGDAGPPGDAAQPDPDMAEGGCPPNPLEGEWAGDLHLRAECGEQLLGREDNDAPRAIDVSGDLIVDPGVVLRVRRNFRVQGNLRIGAGAQILCEGRWMRGNQARLILSRGDDSQVMGTPDAPIVFGRYMPPSGSQNACHVGPIRGEIRHANFHATGFTSLGGTISDIVLDIAHITEPQVGARTWLRVQGPSTIEHAYLYRAQLTGEFTVRRSHFVEQGFEAIIRMGDERCEGERDQPQTIRVEENVFDVPPDEDIFQLGRQYGRVSYPNNHFVRGVPVDQNVTDGRGRGCANDPLGDWGGPLSLEPIAAQPPAVFGPRR